MGILDKDPRYDAELVDIALKPDGTYAEIERLPLMLREGDAQAFSLNYSPQMAGQVAQHNQTDADLTRYKVSSQVDWRGGRGQDFAYGNTNKYHDAFCDTRFANQIVLPPGVQSSVLTNTSEPAIMPGGTLTQRSVKAIWAPKRLAFGGWFNVRPSDNYWAVAEQFTTVGAVTVTSIRIKVSTPDGLDGGIKLAIYTNVGNAPGVLVSSHTLTNAEFPGTAERWITVPIAASLSATTAYWLVLGHVQVVAWPRITWHGGTYAPGGGLGAVTTSSSWASWTNVTSSRPFFLINTEADAAYWLPEEKATANYGVNYLQATTFTYDTISIYCRLKTWTGSGGLTLKLRNSSGIPTSSPTQTIVLTEAQFVSVRASPGWVTINLPSSLTGVAATGWAWWLEATAPTRSDGIELELYQATAASAYEVTNLTYSGSDPSVSSWSFAYATAGLAFYFDNGQALSGSVLIRPVRHGSNWYCAAGNALYRWNTGTNAWDTITTGTAVTITSIASFGGYIYVFIGDANDAVRSTSGNSGTFAVASAGQQWTFSCAYNGYLYVAKSTGGAANFGYTNGTAWTTAVIATSAETITGLAGYANEVVIATTRGLYALGGSLIYQFYDYSHEEAATNGTHLTWWIASGRLYVPIRNSLNADDGQRVMRPSGPDLGEGLHELEQGVVSCMVSESSWLFASIDAGSAGYSSIYAFNGEGWHCLYKSEVLGQRIRSIGMETVTSSTPRLWFFENSTAYYMTIPDLTDNPYSFSGSKFRQSGYMDSSYILGEYSQIVKEFRAIKLITEGCSTGQRVRVAYQIDRSEIWREAGTVTDDNDSEIRLLPDYFAPKFTRAGSNTQRIIVSSSYDCSDIVPGVFVRVGDEVGQVESIDIDYNIIGLVKPLQEAPGEGIIVAPSAPVGREIRYRMTLETDDTTLTPRVRRSTVRYQEQTTEIASLSITVRAEDAMMDRSGAQYPYSAARTRSEALKWLRRPTPFALLAPDGDVFWVKPAGGSYGGFTRGISGIPDVPPMKSSISIRFDEAGKVPPQSVADDLTYSELITSEPTLVRYWKLNEAAGLTYVDAKGGTSATGVGGTIANVTAYGGLLKSIELPGINGPTVSGTTGWAFSSFTIELWVQKTAAGDMRLFQVSMGADNVIVHYSESVDLQASVTGTGSGTLLTSKNYPSDIGDGSWHHVAVTFEASGATIYIDGEIEAVPGSTNTANLSELNHGNPFDIILGGSALGQVAYARLAHCAIYSSVLSAETILAHYVKGVGLS